MSKVSRTQLARVISGKVTSGADKNLAQEVAAYLLEQNRTNELDSLMRDVISERADEGTIEVTAVSAHELAPKNVSEIEAEVRRAYPAAKKIIVNERIDFDQVGGVRLEFPDKQLDLSVRSKLNKLKERTSAYGTF